MTDEITFRFEGQQISATDGQSLAAALTAAGIRTFRETRNGEPRGMFCGMGVCQECLVEVDGQPNQRACMTKAVAGLTVGRQAAAAALTARAAPPRAAAARQLSPDVLVIGGGAGGLNAAIAAADAGATVVVLDERRLAGGQYFKQTAGLAAPLDGQQAAGATLVARAVAAGVEIIAGAEVWGTFDGPRVFAEVDGAPLIATPRTTIIATGAYERPLMVPGWTLPGVMTTGAAQTLWRSYRTLPGRRVALFGSGPLNFQVALELAAGGAALALVAEAAAPPWTSPRLAARMIAADPALTARGGAMVARLTAMGARPRFRTVLERVEATATGLRATARHADGGLTTVEVDAVCMNYGFQPQNEILRLLGAEMSYDQGFDQLRPVRSDDMETSVAGVYAVGDCCGLGGAPAAATEGLIAGLAAARACGHPGDGTALEPARRRLKRHRRFQQALWALHAADGPTLDAVAPDTLICRCEEITKAELDAALADDPHDIGAVKRATRIGMGRCQGRYCGPALARHLAARTGRPVDDLAFFAPRAPIKPVTIATVLATHDAVDGD